MWAMTGARVRRLVREIDAGHPITSLLNPKWLLPLPSHPPCAATEAAD